MSDPTNNKAATIVSTNSSNVPGRTIGFTLMSLLIVFAGFWMQRQGNSIMNASVTATTPGDTPDYAGFNADNWYLPADSLLGFVEIPAATFTMGSNPALDSMAYANERWSASQRQGSVTLPEYYIGRYEVTQDQFRAYLQATGAINNTGAGDDIPGNFPVSNITWAEALAYGRWLEEQLRNSTETPPVLRELLDSGARITLPNEAEWEMAARSSDARIFPWGSEPTSQFANFGGGTVAAVGSKPCPPCAYGLADMSGNLWELTRSPLQDYPYDPADDFVDLARDPIYVMRGGSYADAINNVRAAIRGGADPGVRNPTIGFRLVISTL